MIIYYPGEKNRCPSCTETHWWVGRSSAECHDCGTVLPLFNACQATQKPLIWHGSQADAIRGISLYQHDRLQTT